jgi:hypothetical protein
MTRLPRRRWFVGFSLDPEDTLRAEATRWRDRSFHSWLDVPCWTFRGAQRKALLWNRSNNGPGLFEVFGPLGKDDDGA